VSHRWLNDPTVGQDTSLSLLARAQHGDAVAMEALMGRHLPRLQRWASGRLPAYARSLLDTDDLVQDVLLNTLRRLDHFQPRHDGALLAYLREAVANRIRNEIRRSLHPVDGSMELDDLPAADPSPLDAVMNGQAIGRYEQALAQLDENDRAAIVGRFEMGYSYDALARALCRPSSEAARKVTERAVRRLAALMKPNGV
jgi:RNA polymerase sigma-70 factor, ECF subfamily